MNKKNKVIKFVAVFGILLFFLFIKSVYPIEVYSYSCLPGRVCVKPSGIVEGVYIHDLYGCNTDKKSYSCRGSDENCYGGTTYYLTLLDCYRYENPQYQGCCGAPPVNPCKECSLGDCPAPLTNTGEEKYKLADYRVCNNEGDCDENKKYGDCYENRNDIPTPEEVNVNPDSDDITPLGCQSSSYTGTEINNPINMTALFTDTDGASDIEAISVWLKTDTSIPNTPEYIDSTASSSTANTFTTNSWGFMMHKEGSSWVPYIVNRDVEWVKASYTNGSFAIKGPSSQDMVRVNIKGVTTSGLNTINLNFELDFIRGIADSNKVTDGNYNLFTMVNDVFGFTPYDNYPDTVTKIGDYFNPGQIRSYDSWEDSNKNWYIDLTVPEAKINTVTAEYPTYIKFNSSISDAAGLYGFVSNLYVSPEVENQAPAIEIKVYRTPSLGSVTLGPNPFPLLKYTEELDDGSTIGNLNDGYLVKATNISTSLEEENITVDIDTNREDSMMYFVTAFDMACNAARASTAYDIEDWIVTYGGLVYSAEGIHFVAKNIDNESHWDAISLLNRLDPRYADVSSEMYANNSLEDYSFKREEEINQYEIGPFNAYRAIDFYKDIKTTFERRELGLSGLVERIPTPPGSILTGNLGGGSIKIMDVQGDLTVGTSASAFNCNGKGLFFIKDNLIINGDITNGNLKSDACIFVVNGNVTINAGKDSSGGGLGYDQINAYVLANGDVTITSDSNFDGLYVNGGIQSLGDNGIFMDRYLGLNYRTTHPTFVVDHNSKYGILSTYLIGNPIDLVKVEVGFKPF